MTAYTSRWSAGYRDGDVWVLASDHTSESEARAAAAALRDEGLDGHAIDFTAGMGSRGLVLDGEDGCS